MFYFTWIHCRTFWLIETPSLLCVLCEGDTEFLRLFPVEETVEPLEQIYGVRRHRHQRPLITDLPIEVRTAPPPPIFVSGDPPAGAAPITVMVSHLVRLHHCWRSAVSHSPNLDVSFQQPISGVASYGALGHVPPPSTFNNFIFSSLWGKSDSQLSKYCVVCEVSWCRCQQLTALSISTALVTKLLVIEQLLHLALKFGVSARWHNFQLCPSLQQILATPLQPMDLAD